jgi:hypothetical protein
LWSFLATPPPVHAAAARALRKEKSPRVTTRGLSFLIKIET